MATVTVPVFAPPYRFREDQLYRMHKLGYLATAANGGPSRVRLTVAQYDHLIELGVLTENDKCELVAGEVVEKMPIGEAHVTAVNRISNRLARRCLDRAVVSVQNPVRLPDSEPEPDITLLPDQGGGTFAGKPGPSDVLLLIEVADTSLDHDRDIKGPLYAAAGIRDYWIVDVTESAVHIFRDPRPDGTWGQTLRPGPAEVLEVAALPGVTVTVAELLGSET
jgi:Uma2 family endonuclease